MFYVQLVSLGGILGSLKSFWRYFGQQSSIKDCYIASLSSLSSLHVGSLQLLLLPHHIVDPHWQCTSNCPSCSQGLDYHSTTTRPPGERHRAQSWRPRQRVASTISACQSYFNCRFPLVASCPNNVTDFLRFCGTESIYVSGSGNWWGGG